MQTGASKREGVFRLGWGVEGIVKGAAELTCGRYGLVLLMTRSTMPPNLAEVAALTTLPKTAAKKHHFGCGMHRSMRHARYYKVTHPFFGSTDEWC